MENIITPTQLIANPFPGLRSFGMNESHLFFGREKHVEDVIKKLFAYRFVSIVGSSGSGKSSLIRAGLLPLVYKRLDKFSGAEWKVAEFHPGNSPLKNLVNAFASPKILGNHAAVKHEDFQEDILSVLEESPLGLVEAVRKYNPERHPLLIFIDQFEELFRFKNREKFSDEKNDEAEKFVALFTEAIHQRDVPIYVMITLRADFLGDCSRFSELPEAINDGQYLVPQMSREQIKSVIVKPVELAEGKISPHLLHKLLNDINDKQDQLPILQHAMMRAWDNWKQSSSNGQPIDIEHYEIIGTMSKALSKHADEVFNSLLTGRQKHLTEIIFKTITVKGGDNRGIRRPVMLKKLCEIAEADETEIIEVLDQFRSKGRTFITPALPAKITAETIIDISHESLMRIWERLEKWADEEHQSAILYDRLSESAQLFEEGKSALWRDPELQFAVVWKEKNKPNKAWSLQYNNSFDFTMRFLDISLRERKAEKVKEKKRRILANSFITLFFVSCTLLTMWALQEQKSQTFSAHEAEYQKIKAEQKAKEAEGSKEVAEQKTNEAMQQKSIAEKQTAETQIQKQLAQNNEKIATEKTTEAKQALITSEEEKQKAVQQQKIAEEEKSKAESEKNQKEKLRLQSLAKAMAAKAVSKFDDNELPALLALQAYQFNKENGGAEQDPDIYDALHKSLITINSSNNHVIPGTSEFSTFGFNENNQSIIAASVDGDVISINVKNFQTAILKINNILNKGVINSVYVNSNGQYLAAAYENFNVMIWDLSGDLSSGTELKGHSGYVRAVAFNKNNKTFATAGKDSTILVWDMNNLKSGFRKKIKLNAKISSVVFLSVSNQLAAGTDNGTITLWNYETDEKKSYTNANGISALAFIKTPAGNEKLAAGFSNGKVVLYDSQNFNMTPVKSMADINVAAEKICFNKSASLMAVSGADKIIRIYSTDEFNAKPILLKQQNAKVRAMIFDNQDKLYAAYTNNKIQFWESRCNVLADKICGQVKRNMTESEWQTFIGAETPYRKTCPR